MIRRRLVCRGAVQGVGFRPAVWRLATALGLDGSVRNDPDGARIEVEGPPAVVARFVFRLAQELPALARLDEVDESGLEPRFEPGFRVAASEVAGRRRALVPPDAAPCAACRREMEDPRDRRHRYPFTNCTDCGPRFTLVRSLPYDRARTSMARFELCAECAREYADPASRRFHAEPLSCPACGPRLTLLDAHAGVVARQASALARARAALAWGALLALHGLGGFQLVCRVDSSAAVRRLRRAKERPTKPFAVMARDLEAARRLVELRPADEDLLRSARAPILLAPRRRPAVGVASEVAPGLEDLGVMLPTTPLHAELLRGAPYSALVATSGNARDEPICRTPSEALERLGGIVDRFLVHDREVVRRADDSVVRTAARGTLLVRRSRGWVPEPLRLPAPSPEPVLALGGHLQATACLAAGAEAFPSQHVGDLDTELARAFLLEAALGLEAFLERQARTIAVDAHPDYPSTWAGERLAAERDGRVVRVQHHLAHAAAVLAEHARFPERGDRAAALVLDGTGLGPDGTAWGCEVLLVDGDLGWRRLAHGRELALVGGEAAVREPWRVACAALAHAGAAELLARTPLARRVEPRRLLQVAQLAERGGFPMATGAGRVFEAAGALLGLAPANGYEGEAASRLEALASRSRSAPEPWAEVEDDERAELPAERLLAALALRAARREPPAKLAADFHASFARLAARLVRRVVPGGVRTVALGGGCFVNRLLAARLAGELEAAGLSPLLPRALPPGDGGLSYGQAVVAALSLARASGPKFEGGP